ncbi:hypothetical protein D9M71_648930 [compost metagenome]
MLKWPCWVTSPSTSSICCFRRGISLLILMYSSELSSAWPEMISGVRASSMRMESTSSTTAKFSSRWNFSSRLKAMLSRR